MIHPNLRLSSLHPVHKLLQLIAIRHPPILTRQTLKLTPRLLKRVRLVTLTLRPFLDYLPILLLDLKLVPDINPMPRDGLNIAMQRNLTLPQLLQPTRQALMWDRDLPHRNLHMRGLPGGRATQGTRRLANTTIREAPPGTKGPIALIMDAIRVAIRDHLDALLRLRAEHGSQRREAVAPHRHHGTARDRVIEVDVVLRGGPPRDHAVGGHVHDVRRGYQRAEKKP